jgi:RNA polymerase sigma-70 factor, ECF subfamily
MDSPSTAATAREQELLEAARAGDQDAFGRLVEPHRAQLHAHCYRMLGSVHDAEDALQDCLLRAWRALERFEGRSSLRTWLYTIATNACLNLIERRPKRVLPVDYGPATDPHTGPGEPIVESVWLEPYPDEMLGLEDGFAAPEASYEQREAVELAFIAALQHLPPNQRAVLILREVLGFSAKEIAEALDTTVASVNSALQRARERLERERQEGTLTRPHAPRNERAEAVLMQRFQVAWAAVDIDGIVALLAADSLLTMPPEAARFIGREAIGAFFATAPMEGRLDLIRLVPTRLNGQPAVAAYAEDPMDGVFRAYGVMAFAIDEDQIGGIIGFPHRPGLFERLGLPLEIER